MLDAINNMQSNRMDGVEQFVQYWVKFINCDIDKETFDQMKMSHALAVKSNNKDNKANTQQPDTNFSCLCCNVTS